MTFYVSTSFYDWLMAQNERGDAVGDLARAVIPDKDWPHDAAGATNSNQSYRKCRQYMALQSGDSSPAMDALEQAVAEHRKGQRQAI